LRRRLCMMRAKHIRKLATLYLMKSKQLSIDWIPLNFSVCSFKEQKVDVITHTHNYRILLVYTLIKAECTISNIVYHKRKQSLLLFHALI